MIGIKNDFENIFKFCEEYPDTGHGIPVGELGVAKCVGSLERIGETVQAELGIQDWSFKVSKGAGAFPRIPWIIFGPKLIVKIAPSKGMYLCIAISEDGSGFVAGLNVATAEKKQWQDRLNKVPKEWKLKIDGKKPNTKYSDGFFNPKPFYRKDWQPSELINHLRESADLLLGLDEPSIEPSKQKMYQIKQQPNPNLHYSLLSKPFAILTGNSGTGKTKLAESIAAYLSDYKRTNSALVPVGADWTDNRPVLGFVNHMRTVKDGPVFQTTPILDLLLRASENLDIPHFLLLDEMNLSHVERYFSDFLSAMEARQGMIWLHNEGPRDDPEFRLPRFEHDPSGVPRELLYPPNLFVIGTVNIDETTYMFSPKVLDRAHVIEFQVDAKDIGKFLDDPKELDAHPAAGEAIAKEFLQLALSTRCGKLPPLEGSVKLESNKHLISLLEILQRGRFEFAYRTANEVTRYLRVCQHLADDKKAWSEFSRLTEEEKSAGKRNWLSDLDDEILQKILPRLHGSRNRLGPLLGALACYLHGGVRKAADEYFPADGDELAAKSIGDSEFRAMTKGTAMFPRSFSKIKMMSEVLIEDQFVSFIC